mmetsp:Transcript_106275/g.298950  ORF Transcript_106275/g.298950 Transcript_106275/m.298950 type:complete len:204 (-) Transcript_106275:35-646(-)
MQSLRSAIAALGPFLDSTPQTAPTCWMTLRRPSGTSGPSSLFWRSLLVTCVNNRIVCFRTSAPASSRKILKCLSLASVQRPYFSVRRKTSMPYGVKSEKEPNLSCWSCISPTLLRKPTVSTMRIGNPLRLQSQWSTSEVCDAKPSLSAKRDVPDKTLHVLLLPAPVTPTTTIVFLASSLVEACAPIALAPCKRGRAGEEWRAA